MPCTATRSPAVAPAWRSELNTVMPAHSSGAASSAGKIVGHGRNRLGRDHDVFRVAAVIADSGNLFKLAEDEMAAAAGVAFEAMSAMPADAHPLARLPLCDVGADRIDPSGNLMARERAGIASRESPTALRWRHCGRRRRPQP